MTLTPVFFLAQMLVVASCLSCLDPILTVAAALAHRPPFVSPIDARDRADAAKASFADGGCSDHLASLRAFEAWKEIRYSQGLPSFSYAMTPPKKYIYIYIHHHKIQ